MVHFQLLFISLEEKLSTVAQFCHLLYRYSGIKPMENCIFCQIINKQMSAEFVFEDDHVVAFKDIAPKADTHILIVSRKHIANLNELADDDSSLITEMLLLLPRVAREAGLVNGFRTVINTGKGGGQEVDHIHFHLLGGKILPAFK